MILPTVTVLLPVYNGQEWLSDAVDSVLTQSFRDFELLVMDDGSTDMTPEILAAYRDPRIRTVRQSSNRGLIAVLNDGLDLARGAYVARMDADDVSHPRRLERQVTLLQERPEIGVCGTWFRGVGGTRTVPVRPPVEHDEISAMLFFRSAFGHPTVMVRSAFLQESSLRYSASARHAEDFDLWVRARERTNFANVPEYLLEYRMHANQTSVEHMGPQSDAAARIRLEQLGAMLPSASEAEKSLHLRTCDGYRFSVRSELLESRAWLDHLEETNRSMGMFPTGAFGQALASAWTHCCHRTRLPPPEVFRIFLTRRYSGVGMEVVRRHFVLALRALRRPVTD